MLSRLLFLFFAIPITLFGQVEICDNAIDDDNDGLIDLNDSDCICEEISFSSLIPNPSFEDVDCCPGNHSELQCASGWIQASEPTTDFAHTCGWPGWPGLMPPLPFPDGDGVMGFRDGRLEGLDGKPELQWKEYAGVCLNQPLIANVSYRYQFDLGFVNRENSPPIDLTFFGTGDCANLPFGVGDRAFGCPTNDPNWVELGVVSVSGGVGSLWVNEFIDIEPRQDI